MVQYNPLQYLPTEEDLPETDNIPVDNELQILIPTLLRAILALLWTDRQDWFFGVNLGIYYDRDQPAIGPDAFLSLGVPRRKKVSGRLSYVVWQENNIVPQWVLEVVSKTPGGEYDDKMTKYAGMGVLYYTIYNPDYWKRDEQAPFEVYRLVNGAYLRQPGNPVWMPEIGLGIGYELGTHEDWTRDWLYWYDQQGNRFPAPENVIEQERQRALSAEQQLRELITKLRERGIDPNTL
ncbi:MAG: Uma2 family endonuclease [Chroococcidiopsidaceae cyanobacterium CP_BM_RX_35]|nr:Uma2 family endonuclease [Chroococcidiopsidaceae cyanobacterium CP_BM_RX_35]